MRGFSAFLGKELREIFRTWRIWVLPGIVLFFAISGPPLAKITPQLLNSLVPPQSGMVIKIPEPTYIDGYLQWTKNLSQLVLFAIIIMFGGAISAEKKSGTAALVLTKPLSRAAFVVAKFIANLALVLAAVVAGAILTWGLTLAIFGEAPVTPIAQATGAWLLLAALFVALMVLLSAVLDSQAGAAGLGFVGYIVLSIVTLWKWPLKYSPAALINAPNELLAGKPLQLAWPIAATVLLTVVLVGAAVFVFDRREL